MTSDARFTLDDVLNATRKIVEEKGGDYRYDPEGHGCLYAADGTPSCLVGHVINALDPEAFTILAGMEADRSMSMPAVELRDGDWLAEDFWSDDAEVAMQAAQDAQDSGLTWGQAVYAAENLGADAD
mgnify:CR=1 FL=1